MQVILIAASKNKSLIEITQNAINTAKQDDCEVIVVETHKVIKYQNAKVYLYKHEFNYNKCLNFGISKTTHEYIALCNNDLEFSLNWTNIIKTMKQNNILSASSYCPVSMSRSAKMIEYGYEIRRQIAGWMIVINRKILDIIGKLNEDVKFWRSDNIYAEQLKTHNIKHALIRDSVVTHLDNGSNTLQTLDNSEHHEFTHGQYNINPKLEFKYKFSIVIPSYLGMYKNCATNRKKKLERAIKSIFKQTYTNYEIILVADGCDETVSIYRKYQRKGFKCIKIKKQKYLAGIVRQIGIDNAIGEYIIYLDSDDFYGDNHLKSIAAKLQDYEWVYFDDYVNANPVYRKNVSLALGSSGTSSICHKRLLTASWKNKDGYAHDFRFIQELMKYKNSAKIKAGEYYICHTAHSVLDT